MNPIKLVACRTVMAEIEGLYPFGVECISMDAGLHLKPELFTETVQAVIDKHTAGGETLVLGYGLCSMGVIGLQAGRGTLVIPNVDDCIAMFLGSRDRYRRILLEEPGTYFLSRGWIDAKITPADYYDDMKIRYGAERAWVLMERLLRHFTRLLYLDMGHAGDEAYRRRAREIAEAFNLRFETIQGEPELLGEIAAGRWDKRFVVVPPGGTVRLEDFEGSRIRGRMQ